MRSKRAWWKTLKVELSCVGKGTPGCVGAEYVSIGDVVPG